MCEDNEWDEKKIYIYTSDWSKNVSPIKQYLVGLLTFDSNKTKKNEFDKKYFGTSIALCVIRIGEFAQLDVACP